MFEFLKHPLVYAPLSVVFDNILSRSWNRETVSEKDGFEAIEFTSGQPGDTCNLSGWIYKEPGISNDSGTCFMMHGFCDNSANLFENAQSISRQFNVTVVSFDHRFHGNSQRRYPTFGCYESFDVQAAMDMADSKRLPKPYILHGTSLGGMAAQRAGIIDHRVDAMFLIAVPGWPWDAIGKCALAGTPFANLISIAYGWDVLNDGNIMHHRQADRHRPLVCYAMGTWDQYDINLTKQVFNHWHNNEEGLHNQFPSKHPECRKFFHSFDKVVHPGSNGKQLWECSEFHDFQYDFYNQVLDKKQESIEKADAKYNINVN